MGWDSLLVSTHPLQRAGSQMAHHLAEPGSMESGLNPLFLIIIRQDANSSQPEDSNQIDLTGPRSATHLQPIERQVLDLP
jgi:hypothetical protein